MISEIKKEQIAARKLAVKGDAEAAIKGKLLTTIIGELETKAKGEGKEVTDEMVVATLKKFATNIEETIQATKSAVQREHYKKELDVINFFMPKQLTEEELTAIITELKNNGANNIGLVMKALKENHAGLYNGKQAQQICKNLL